MNNPGIEEALWSALNGRLWHATSESALKGIVKVGQIRPAMGHRYAGSFCRSIGGVCLFDFGPSSEHIDGQLRNWIGWFGHQQNTRVAAWLEIDRDQIVDGLFDAAELRVASKKNLAERSTEADSGPPITLFIPGVDACHKGPIRSEVIVGALLIDRHNSKNLKKIHGLSDDIISLIREFETGLPHHEEDHS